MGMIVSSYPLYIGEISAPSIRGALACLIMNGFPLGIFFGNIMGPNMSMMNFSIISLVMMLCHMVIFPFLPQSPYYYVRHNDTKRWIRLFCLFNCFTKQIFKVMSDYIVMLNELRSYLKKKVMFFFYSIIISYLNNLYNVIKKEN